MKRVLVTGGAGFIGSHLCDALLEHGAEVMVFDCLMPQVHPKSPQWPDYLDLDRPGIKPWFGDVRDSRAVLTAMMDFRPDTVIHLAALVGVGQSNEKIANYVSANVTGTAVLLNCILDYNRLVDERAASLALLAEDTEVVPQVKEDGTVETQQEADARYHAWRADTETEVAQLPDRKVVQVFVAGSMSSYGEGVFVHGDAETRHFSMTADWMDAHGWRHRGLREDDDLIPASVYASTKAEQERLALIVGEVGGLDVRVGRFFNVYGDRQALTNPYTGVMATFAARCLAGLAPRVYEDGQQSRDFIHVSDVCSAIITILEHGYKGGVFNIGTGQSCSIARVARLIATELDGPDPEITGQVRAGDIKHAYANTSKLEALGWSPRVRIENGVKMVCEWAKLQSVDGADLDAAHRDLLNSGLLREGPHA